MTYEPFDGPSEERLFRDQSADEKRRRKIDYQIIDRLLWEIKPEDGTCQLFTFGEIQEWGLRNQRKR